jgi:hypothetical protein
MQSMRKNKEINESVNQKSMTETIRIKDDIIVASDDKLTPEPELIGNDFFEEINEESTPVSEGNSDQDKCTELLTIIPLSYSKRTREDYPPVFSAIKLKSYNVPALHEARPLKGLGSSAMIAHVTVSM